MDTNYLLNTGMSLAELLLATVTVGVGGFTAGRQMAIARIRTERRALVGASR